MNIINTLELAKQIFPFVIASVTSGLTWDVIKAIIEKALEPVEIENRIKPPHNVAIPAIQGIAFNSDNEILQNMFYTLLTKSMDKTQQSCVHPAFPKILGQLSVEEILYLYSYVGQSNQKLFSTNSKTYFNCQRYIQNNRNIYYIKPHLISLGLFATEDTIIHKDTRFSMDSKEPSVQLERSVELSPFGKQFIEACLSPEAEKLIQELMDNA